MSQCQITDINPEILADGLLNIWIIGGVVLLIWSFILHTIIWGMKTGKMGRGYAFTLIMNIILVVVYGLLWLARKWLIMLIY